MSVGSFRRKHVVQESVSAHVEQAYQSTLMSHAMLTALCSRTYVPVDSTSDCTRRDVFKFVKFVKSTMRKAGVIFSGEELLRSICFVEFEAFIKRLTIVQRLLKGAMLDIRKRVMLGTRKRVTSGARLTLRMRLLGDECRRMLGLRVFIVNLLCGGIYNVLPFVLRYVSLISLLWCSGGI